MPDIFTGVLDVDNTAPVVSSLFPAPLSTGVPVGTSISFDVTDAGAGVNLSSLDVIIAAQPAILNGAFAPGFSGTITTIPTGYSVLINLGSPLAYYENVVVDYYVEDQAAIFNSTSGSWSFTSESDLTGPVISALNPADDALNVSVSTSVSFEATDPETGVDSGSLYLTINGTPAVVAGVVQPGFTGTVIAILNGFSVTATPTSLFPSLALVSVEAKASNNALPSPVETTQNWNFTCADSAAPIFSVVTPSSGEIDVPKNTNVIFMVSDDAGVNPLSIDVTLSGQPAITNGVFQAGFTGTIVPTPDSTLFVVTINPDSDFGSHELVAVDASAEDTSGNLATDSWSFQCLDDIPPSITNQVPANGASNVPHNTLIFFSVLDPESGVDPTQIDATVNGAPAVINGVPQAGYLSSTISPIPNGYEVKIQADALFGPYETVNLFAEAHDLAGNSTTASWSFQTLDDLLPSISNLNPVGGSTNVANDANVLFEIRDVGSGVDLNSIHLTIDGVLAVDVGVVQPGFIGSVTPIAGGYLVQARPSAGLPGSSTILVTAVGSDNAGNTTTVPWSFTTVSSVKFLMRAFNTSSLYHVYWLCDEEPDSTGAFSPYPPAELEDIVVSDRLEGGANAYLMRARNTTLSSYVYWLVFEEPDQTGSLSPYPPAELEDVVISEVIENVTPPTPLLLQENEGILLLEDGDSLAI